MPDSLINSLAQVSLLFAATAAYLQINKLWQRKHVPAVADSISLSGILVKLVPLTFFGLYFLSNGEIIGIVDSSIWLVTGIVVAMIGAGFWVPGKRGKGIWRLALSSLRQERTELTYLARRILHPSSSKQLLDVLTAMALVDGDVDPREQELIQHFIDEWGLELDWSLVLSRENESRSVRLINVRDALVHYLETSPSKTQVGHLGEVLKMLIEADSTRSEEEDLAFEEVNGMLAAHLADGDSGAGYTVVIAPQDDEQNEAIALLLKEADTKEYAGGRGYAVGRFHSTSYAEFICSQYRSMGFFTVVIYG